MKRLDLGGSMSLAVPPGVLRLAGFLPYRLAVSGRAVGRALARRYEARFGLAIPEWRCLAVLSEDGDLTASALAERASLDKVQTSRAVARLVARGAIARAPDPHDRRAQRLVLTPAGRELYAEVAEVALAFEREVTRALGLSERRALDRVLAKLDAAVARLQP